MMTAAVRIRSEMVSMSTSGRSVCSALLDERQPPFAPPHTATAVTRIEHRQQLVRYITGMAVQPATQDMFFMLAASSGATENAWLSDTGSPSVRNVGTFPSTPFTY